MSMTDINDKEICFIICTNDLSRYEECCDYINHLYVPEGMSIDIISVQDAPSICEGYNAGMQSSNAKYKVYLHHDTFIINRNFISDMLKCFKAHPKAGLLGMVGRTTLPDDEFLYGHEQYGAVYETDIYKTVTFYQYPLDEADVKVMHVDGLLMMTCVDIPWREDILDGWDLYDVSQSLEMLRAGYEVWTPYMDKPWVLHDCGLLSLKNYSDQKGKFLKEYTDFEYTKYPKQVK